MAKVKKKKKEKSSISLPLVLDDTKITFINLQRYSSATLNIETNVFGCLVLLSNAEVEVPLY